MQNKGDEIMSKEPKFDFKGKYIIRADIRTLTGLHIGGTEEGFDIGGVDNPVIKDKITGLPYIPGSSLKGKLRSLLEWVIECNGNASANSVDDNQQNEEQQGSTKESHQSCVQKSLTKNKDGNWEAGPCKCGTCDVCVVFGTSAESHTEGPTRLTVLDAWPDGLFDEHGKRIEEEQKWEGTIKDWTDYMGEKIYTEVKTENTIDRLTSAANPRSMERVPADSVFKVEFIYDVYHDDDIERLKILFQGIKLLEDSTLGGGGSRGSGRVRFEKIKIETRDISHYVNGRDEKLKQVNQNGNGTNNKHDTATSILDNFDVIFKNSNSSSDNT